MSLRAAQPYGLDQRPAVGAFLNGRFPPNQAEAGKLAVVPAFTNLSFAYPVGVVPEPGSNRLCVNTREGRIYAFENDPSVRGTELLLDLTDSTQGWDDCGLLGFAFHPEFAKPGSTNRAFIYVFYQYSPAPLNGPGRPPEKTVSYNRLSRFTLRENSRVFDRSSELVLLDLYDRSVWHNGGAMFFHPADGFLYVSVGDEGGTNAEFGNTQRLNGGLFSGVLRIDVDQNPGRSHPIRRQPATTSSGTSRTANYFIPDDNPFVDPTGSNLEEFWSIGLRSPHRMTVDPLTGEVWLGDVGQAFREEINLIQKGGNYQWGYREGHLEGPRPKPDLISGTEMPPVYDYPHSIGTSISDGDNCVIGGYVYRGMEHATLLGGRYIFGDNGSGRIWSLSRDGAKVAVDVVATMPPGSGYNGLTSFGIDHSGELFLCQGGSEGRILRLARPVSSGSPPATLSATGAFADLATMRPAPGLVAYDVNSPLWSDGSTKFRWIALPGGATGTPSTTGERISLGKDGYWKFPTGTVFVKHFELATEESRPFERRRLETRFLVRDNQGGVYGITYKWRPDGTDADLLSGSVREELPGNGRAKTWTYPSPRDCVTCHTPNAGHVLGVTAAQLNGAHFYPETGRTDNQLRTWNHLGMLPEGFEETEVSKLVRLVRVDDETMPLERRVRSYLAANCSHCHRPGGVNAYFDARYETPLLRQNLINGPLHQSLGVKGAAVIVPGDVERSVLFHRMSSIGEHQMPPLARGVVDQSALQTVRSWIESLPRANTVRGVRGEYFDNPDFTAFKLTRIDNTIAFDWGTGSPSPLMGPETFSVRWSGEIETVADGLHTFYTLSDDGVRLWIGDQLVIDNWTPHAPTENRGTIQLNSGRTYPIRLHYFEDTGGALMRLTWSGPGFSRQSILPGRLTTQVDPKIPMAAPVLRWRRSETGLAGLELDVDVAAVYTVESSDDLERWAEIARITGGPGLLEVNNSVAATAAGGARFYRAVGRKP